MLDLDYILDDGDPDKTEPIVLELADLYDDSGHLLAKGVWKFEITLPNTALELTEQPVKGIQVRDKSGGIIEVTATSVRLDGMSLRITFESWNVDTYEEYHFGACKAVMLDGSTVELLPCGTGHTPDGDKNIWWAEFYE